MRSATMQARDVRDDNVVRAANEELDAAETARIAKKVAREKMRRRESVVLLGVSALVAAAVAGARAGRWTAGSDLGYGLGLAGGIAMLLLFLYPVRKRLKFARHFGGTRIWFALHMLLGVAGPLLVILHSRLAFGSLNAIVAFSSMALVASSGLVGRFLYARIHLGLYGEKATLADLRAQADEGAEAVRGLLALPPEVVERLDAFALRAETIGRAGLARPIAFFMLGFEALSVRRRSIADVRASLQARADAEHWDRASFTRRLARRRSLIAAYMASVQRLAQFAVFERLFSWWHVLHVPLVWLMVASAIAHVVAVHMY